MKLSDHDLRQIDSAYLAGLTREQLLHVSEQLLGDLKEARDRANQTPHNSSRLPESRAPWEKAHEASAEEARAPRPKRKRAGDRKMETPEGWRGEGKGRQAPGKQPGSAGHGRPTTLPVSSED
jgi:hypothetical protein